MSRREEAIDFATWVLSKNMKAQDLYTEFSYNDEGEVTPNYDSDLVGTFFASEDLASIMADNANTELEWCLNNSYTMDDLYEMYLIARG